MAIEICTVGGFNEVGKNMTAVKVDDEVVIIDMGLYLDPYIKYTQDAELEEDISANKLLKIGALPDIKAIKKWQKNVVAIVPTHAHLDHVGAIPYLAPRFDAPVICTPFTAEVIKAICRDESIRLPNEIKVLNPNSKIKVSEKMTVEFINMTHSTPQTVMVLVHTPYGKVLYGNDFKFDNRPVLGKKPNYDRLKQLKDEDVVCLVVDSTRSESAQKTPSEQVAKEMLKDVMLGCDSKDKAIFVTTFSSHLARLQSIVDFGRKLNRKIVFLGRSLGKYVAAGENIGIINFTKDVEVIKYKKKIAKKLKQMSRDPSNFLIVCTGHQGEEKSVLSRIANKDFDFRFSKEDHIIFSCSVIPTALNKANRELLESKLRGYGVRIFKDIHVSGHAAREDLRDLINMVQPQHIIPAHGDMHMSSAMAELCTEMDYRIGEDVHIMRDGQFITFE